MKYSIIVPVYNAEKYIRQCVDSVLRQTCNDFELILVDDGSSDGSADILNEYASCSNVVMIQKKNGGVSSARNAGLDVAKGDWVSFVDSDDVLEECCLENFDKLERKADVNFFSSVDFFEDSSTKIHKMIDGYSEGEKDIQRAIYYLKTNPGFEFFGVTWNKFFRNSIIQKYHIRFDQRISYREDELFTSNFLAYAKSVATMSAIGYRYRKIPCGLHASGQNAKTFEILAEAIDVFVESYALPELKRRECSRALHLMFRAYIISSDEMRLDEISEKVLLMCRKYHGNLNFSKSLLALYLVSKLNLTCGKFILSLCKKMRNKECKNV